MIRDGLLLDNPFASATHAAVTCCEPVQERFLYRLRYGSLRRSNESWLSENTATYAVDSCGQILNFRIQIVRSQHFFEASLYMTSLHGRFLFLVVLVSQYPAGYPGFWCGVCAPPGSGFNAFGTRRVRVSTRLGPCGFGFQTV